MFSLINGKKRYDKNKKFNNTTKKTKKQNHKTAKTKKNGKTKQRLLFSKAVGTNAEC